MTIDDDIRLQKDEVAEAEHRILAAESELLGAIVSFAQDWIRAHVEEYATLEGAEHTNALGRDEVRKLKEDLGKVSSDVPSRASANFGVMHGLFSRPPKVNALVRAGYAPKPVDAFTENLRRLVGVTGELLYTHGYVQVSANGRPYGPAEGGGLKWVGNLEPSDPLQEAINRYAQALGAKYAGEVALADLEVKKTQAQASEIWDET